MKTSTLKSQSGFSLVELMVVVAIIGILAAMSVGQVQKQIAKARQSEAKTNLAALYTAESAFRAEFNTFASDFGVMKLDFSGTLRYSTGFTAQHLVLADYNAFGVTTAMTNKFGTGISGTAGYCGAAPGAAPCGMSKEAVACAAAASATNASQAAFKAQACSNVYDTAAVDEWTIDNNKLITMTNAGIP